MLTSLVQDELAAAQALLELLEGEYAALRARDAAEVRRLTVAKQSWTQRLHALSGQRAGWLRQQGFSPDAAGMAALLAGLDAGQREPLEAAWTALLAVADQARRQNEINGAIIAVGRSQTERALAILHGGDGQDGLYDQSAQTAGRSGCRQTLAKV